MSNWFHLEAPHWCRCARSDWIGTIRWHLALLSVMYQHSIYVLERYLPHTQFKQKDPRKLILGGSKRTRNKTTYSTTETITFWIGSKTVAEIVAKTVK